MKGIYEAALLLLIYHFRQSEGSKYGFDYCDESMSCAGPNGTKRPHLLCKFKHRKAVGNCTNIRGGMTPEERGRILALHNVYRDAMVQSWKAYFGGLPYIYDKEGHRFQWRETPYYFYRDNNAPREEGLDEALCMRQLAWGYGNEKMAQIYAEQCTAERYDCSTEFREEFPQYMSVFTEEGIHEGNEFMQKAFDQWLDTRHNMITKYRDGTRIEQANVYYFNRLFNYTYTDRFHSKFVDWANIAYWRTFILGCGKAHFQEGGKDWTRIVCIYGPGVNYIPVLREILASDPGAAEPYSEFALYVRRKDGQCVHGGRIEKPPFAFTDSSCPHFLCSCRADLGLDKRLDFDSSWPWLCANECVRYHRKEIPIPSYLDYLKRSTARRMRPLVTLVLSSCLVFSYHSELLFNPDM